LWDPGVCARLCTQHPAGPRSPRRQADLVRWGPPATGACGWSTATSSGGGPLSGLRKRSPRSLRTTWSGQLPSGQSLLWAAMTLEDTAIAMFTIVSPMRAEPGLVAAHELEAEVVHMPSNSCALAGKPRWPRVAHWGRYGLLAKALAMRHRRSPRRAGQHWCGCWHGPEALTQPRATEWTA